MKGREVILGVNGYPDNSHDASASLVIGGKLVAVAEEERFTRKKHAYDSLPTHAIGYVLKKAGLTVDDVDVLATGWNYNKLYTDVGKTPPPPGELIDMYLPKKNFDYTKKPELEMVDHHVAHAASAYMLSGFNESLIVVADGQGEDQSTSVFRGRGNDIQLVSQQPVSDSLGFFYEGVSMYVGLSGTDAGKTMGLASYGTPRYEFDNFEFTPDGYSIGLALPRRRGIDLQSEARRAWLDYLTEKFGDPNYAKVIFSLDTARFGKDVEFGQHYKDIAASAQRMLERTVGHIIDVNSDPDEDPNLCIAGGVGLNCSMNGVIARSGQVRELFVPPFSDDGGVSVGAALYVSGQRAPEQLKSAALGPEFSMDQIRAELDRYGLDYKVSDDVAGEVAELLTQGNVVDWFQGPMEAGPRALGNRSILADPRDRNTHRRLNEIKHREQWRPLAPSVKADKLDTIVADPSSSPFMLRAFHGRPGVDVIIPAAIHVDNTTRAQTVVEEVDPLYYRVIDEFDRRTGVPVVMDTSFNREDEPIVCTPREGVRTFFTSGADVLAIGDAIISKKP